MSVFTILLEHLPQIICQTIKEYIPETFLCEQLVNMINDNKTQLNLHPGCYRKGYKHFGYGPISRSLGPGIPGPWIYKKPDSCVLTFSYSDLQESKDQLNNIIDQLLILDDILDTDRDQDVQLPVVIRRAVACDTKSMLYNYLDSLGIIESNVPEWYVSGKF